MKMGLEEEEDVLVKVRTIVLGLAGDSGTPNAEVARDDRSII